MGTLKLVSTNQQYTKYNYSYDSKTYIAGDIHVFTTGNKDVQSIAPAYSIQKLPLSDMNPSPVSSSKVIAKTNGNVWNQGTGTSLGFFYQGPNYPLFVNGTAYSSANIIKEDNQMFEAWYYPNFCVKNDGSATIRWFENPDSLKAALPYCRCIIGSFHPLVFNGKNIFTEKVYDAEPSGRLIMYPEGTSGGEITHFMESAGDPGANRYRTLLGHKKNSAGVYFMVSTDAQITCKVAASFMKDLGCDYAVNMDGSDSVEMRIRDGYGANGKVTNKPTGRKINTAVCAYEL